MTVNCQIIHSSRRAVTTAAVLGALGASLHAQPYSAGLADNDNAYDAPIPGFTGPGGEGKSNVPGHESPDGPTSVNPIFLNWADTVVDYSYVEGNHSNGDPFVTYKWDDDWKMLDEVTGDRFFVASLGDLDTDAITAGKDPGSVTLSFAEPIQDFTGADFAVFEFAFLQGFNGEVFGELAYVEVSSNGVDFARFPSISLTEAHVGAYGPLNPSNIYNLAGKHVNAYGDSWGTPFDLAELAEHPLISEGKLDLDAITHIRLVDVPGSGDFLDSLGNPIYDAWVTYGSGGADIDAVGAVGQALTFDEWNNGRGLTRSGNPDDDRWDNLAEYALRLDPETADGHSVTCLERESGGPLEFVFPRDERNADVVYIIETQVGSLFENQWTEAARFGPLHAVDVDETIFAGYETINQSPQASLGVLQEVRLELADTLPSGGRFVRLRIEEISP